MGAVPHIRNIQHARKTVSKLDGKMSKKATCYILLINDLSIRNACRRQVNALAIRKCNQSVASFIIVFILLFSKEKKKMHKPKKYVKLFKIYARPTSLSALQLPMIYDGTWKTQTEPKQNQNRERNREKHWETLSEAMGSN